MPPSTSRERYVANRGSDIKRQATIPLGECAASDPKKSNPLPQTPDLPPFDSIDSVTIPVECNKKKKTGSA